MGGSVSVAREQKLGKYWEIRPMFAAISVAPPGYSIVFAIFSDGQIRKFPRG